MIWEYRSFNSTTKDERGMFFSMPRSNSTRLLTPQSRTPCQMFIFNPDCKISRWNFPWPGPTRRHPFEAPIYPILTGLDRISVRIILCSPFFIVFFIRWCILMFIISLNTYYQNLAWPLKKDPHQMKTTPFPARPISWIPDRTVPWIKQNMAP